MNYPANPRALTLRVITLVSVIAMLVLAAQPSSQGSNYAVYTTDGRRSLPFRSSGGTDMVPLAQVATLFNVTVAEDALVGGLTLRGRGQTILLIPGQSFASIGPGRIVSLPAPIQRDRGAWQVPVDFITLALGPSLNVRTELRRAKRVILVGDVRLPQVSGRFEPQGVNGRLVLEIQPATPHRVTRQGNRLIVRFDAVAIDFTPVTGLVPDLASAIRADGTSLVIDLGPGAVGYRADDVDPTHLAITLNGPAPAVPPPPPPPPTTPAAAPAPPAGTPGVPVVPALPAPGAPVTPEAAPLPVVEAAGSGTLRTIVIDPGHGGDDVGTKGPGGTLEKNYVLAFARRLKSTIEGRIGLRVLLTRDKDENVPLDRRASLANNNKADLFISLHTNGASRPSVRGSQVLSLRLNDYAGRSQEAETTELPVAFLGGGTRVIDVLPWDLAQIGFTERSATVATILTRHLTEAQIPLFSGPATLLPLRPLVGANMPAIMLELGFLTSPDDERELNGSSHPAKLIEAVLRTIADIRRGALLASDAEGQ